MPLPHDHHDHAHHDHAHHDHAPKSFGTAFAVGAVLNIGLVGAQVVYGLAAHSMALLADAAHNAGDVLGLLLAWGAFLLGRRLPSARRTYGLGRGTILAALANSAVLLVSVGAIALEAVQRLAAPAAVAETTVIVVAGAGIAINGVTAWLFARGHDDLNIRATFLHMVGDAAISAGVVAAAVVMMFTGWLWVDPLASLLIAALIAASTWGVLRDSVNLAVDGVPQGIAPHEVEAWLAGLPGVVEVHDLHIWGLSTTESALTAHLVRDEQADDQHLIRTACAGLGTRFRIGHATLQVETASVAASCRLRPEDVV
jgi:cobalt-zinc-cadmium efflux system protein